MRLAKPNHYTIVMGDFNAQIGKRTNPMETATLKFRLMNTMFQKNAWRRLTRISPNGATKTEIDYILTNRPDNVTDVTSSTKSTLEVTRLVMTNTKLDIEVETK